MMDSRRLGIAALLVLLLIGLVAVLARQEQARQSIGDGKPLWLPALKPALADIARVRMQSAHDTATLVRGAAGWGIAERDGYPADFKAIEQLLDALARARLVEQKTARTEYLGRLGLADIEQPDSAAVLLEAWGGGEKPLVRVMIGKSAEGRSGRYVRAADETQAWLIDNAPQPMAEPTDWMDKRLLEIDFARVRAVTRTLPDGGSFRLARADAQAPGLAPDAPLPAGKRAKYDTVFDAAARAILSATLEDVRRADAIAFEPAKTQRARIEAFDGLRIDVEAIKLADGNWVRIAAVAEPATAPAPAGAPSTAAPANATATPATPDAAPADAGAKAPASPAAEAKALAARFDGWAFRVSDYVYGELAKTLVDYLDDDKPAAPDAKPG